MIPVIIPARMQSSRFPGKPLATILGKSMIQMVCELSELAVGRDNVFVATDHEEIVKHVESLGYVSVMTSDKCETGTDRVAEAMRTLGLSKAINVQGDEPLVDPALIQAVARETSTTKSIINCFQEEISTDEFFSKSVPKVVLGPHNRLLYASRSPIPYSKSGNPTAMAAKKQVCVYGLWLDLLDNFGPGCSKAELEAIEDIEILRFLENDLPVRMLQSSSSSIAVDFPEDILAVEREILEGQIGKK